MKYFCFTGIRCFQLHIVVGFHLHVLIRLHVVVYLLDDIMTCGAERYQRLILFTSRNQCTYGREFCCNFIFCHRIYATAALPVRKLFQCKAQRFCTGSCIPIQILCLGLQCTSWEITECHSKTTFLSILKPAPAKQCTPQKQISCYANSRLRPSVPDGTLRQSVLLLRNQAKHKLPSGKYFPCKPSLRSLLHFHSRCTDSMQ